MAAVFRNVLLLVLAILLTTILEECVGQKRYLHGRECDCVINYYGCHRRDHTCFDIDCYNILTVEEVRCAQKLLNESVKAPRLKLSFNLWVGDLGLFPDNFFENYPLVALVVYNSKLTEMPRFITSACAKLTNLRIESSRTLKTIGGMAFSNCTSLKSLELPSNGIEQVSPTAFHGLTNLESLYINGNPMTRFNGLEGIPQLKNLYLSGNNINYVHKHAFRHLRNLSFIDLNGNQLTTLEEGTFDPITSRVTVIFDGNPLNCNCSLKWLKDWCIAKGQYLCVNCGQQIIHLTAYNMSYWENMRLTAINMSHCPPAMKSIEDGSTDQDTTENPFFISFLMYALTRLFDTLYE